jgi:MinD-like ATPase involved in chromosome partitioning or flagellar assembly
MTFDIIGIMNNRGEGMSLKNGQVLCFSSFKGGVGKTITVLNLAGIYHLLDKKVLIIDFDLCGGGVALALNFKPRHDLYDLIEHIKLDKFTSFDNYVFAYNNNIDVLPSPVDLKMGFKLNLDYIDDVIIAAKTKYDVILIDTTHALSHLNLMLWELSDLTLFIITNDPLDLNNAQSLLKLLKTNQFSNYKIILNNARDTNKNYFSLFDIRKIIKHHVDYTIDKSFNIKNIDRYILEGEILLLNKKIKRSQKNNFNKYVKMAKSLINETGGK